uniref:Winged helix-turn-helix domain-containing protein n=1 Tax=Arion vulgaris TaxID=1028688 RepID=A0A0B7AA72_9EUPU
MASNDEEVVMTPSKKGKVTHIKIERRRKHAVNPNDVVHVAGGQHQGLVVNRPDAQDEDLGKPQLQLGFLCFLVDIKTDEHYVESRKLKFWYVEGTDYYNQVTTAYEFFKELVRPENFPRDYVGFIKKCMKQMQKSQYLLARKVDLEVEHLDGADVPTSPGFSKVDNRPIEEIVREKLLTVLESAYPNVLSVEDLVRISAADASIVTLQLQELQTRQLIQPMGTEGGFVRKVLDDKTKVQMVKNMPMIASNLQPTIAIITYQYCEKMAVDAMMEDKTTYVRYKTEGESNVYTTGYIGEHKVVTTKLPAIGHFRAAQISSGNTTTRLLGTFQNIEHVFLVGCSGSVPHFTDYFKHGRLGDVVISYADDNGQIYYFCDNITQDKSGDTQYNVRTWAPRDPALQKIASRFRETIKSDPTYAPWEQYITEGQELLQSQEQDYNRPPKGSDRLYMGIGEGQVIEVQHPQCPDGEEERKEAPVVRFGVLGAGRPVNKEMSRHDFASRYSIQSFDTEFDQVLDSILGNRKDSFLFVRGLADYIDGSKNKEWQPYAALSAAAVTKAIIMSLHNKQLDEF